MTEITDPVPALLVALAEVAAQMQAVTAREAELVAACRAAGISWEAIAAPLGKTKQAVWKMYGAALGESAPDTQSAFSARRHRR